MQPKEPKAASISWFERTPALPNDEEMLFFSLLVVSSGRKVDELNKWAAEVLYVKLGKYGQNT